ncbi:hypothetical protein BpHYR1_011023 [Brachionus plicatilis]|uniref:Uncharacterized protein n=1 Tax=Brachionus plicatilis TaxID=10195 RepID=A0A3M7SBI5_BRAPC|nr:hypothetical protein BpHYR1_011023 [Brachionus plicatilis]
MVKFVLENNHLIVEASIQSNKIFLVPKNKTGKLKGNLGTVPLDRALLQLNENLQNLNSSIKEIMSQNRVQNQDDPGQTLGHYQKTYPNSMLEIKNELQKYVPKNSTFKEAWEKAANSFKMDKSSKKTNLI